MATRYASIDIGTNTLRLLIAETDGKKLNPLFLQRIITRLGGDYKEDIGISPAAEERTINALGIFAEKIKEYGVKEIKAVATSVVRRAKNKKEFLKNVLERTGLDVRVISGDEEARLSLLGVLSVIENGNKKCLVVDIGGGSTEFIAVDAGKMIGAWSMEMGVVHLTEIHLKNDPPTRLELDAMEEEIFRVIENLKELIGRDKVSVKSYSTNASALFVGTAGTITTLASIDQGLEEYDADRINNYVLKYETVKKMYQWLASMPLKEREKVLSLEKGREDIIIPGAAIVLKAMEGFGFDSITVSDAGLLEGILLDSCKLQVASCK
ncbi:MAG: Ppx/GppA phosphatase family protein [Deltaproteobacteria bacterium]